MTAKYRVLVCGSRNYPDQNFILRDLDELLATHGDIAVISGMAKGADTFAANWAKRYNIELLEYPAQWDVHDLDGTASGIPCWNCVKDARRCPAAGPRRNQLMLDDSKPDIAYAYPHKKSRGTADMIRRLSKAGIPTVVAGQQTLFTPGTES